MIILYVIDPQIGAAKADGANPQATDWQKVHFRLKQFRIADRIELVRLHHRRYSRSCIFHIS
jgi:hypothetical protein